MAASGKKETGKGQGFHGHFIPKDMKKLLRVWGCLFGVIIEEPQQPLLLTRRAVAFCDDDPEQRSQALPQEKPRFSAGNHEISTEAQQEVVGNLLSIEQPEGQRAVALVFCVQKAQDIAGCFGG